MSAIDQIKRRLAAAESAVYANTGPSPVLVEIRAAVELLDKLDLYEEHEASVPVSVQEFNEDGSPAMRDDMVQPTLKSHIEWVAKRRLVTPWVEVGERRHNLT